MYLTSVHPASPLLEGARSASGSSFSPTVSIACGRQSVTSFRWLLAVGRLCGSISVHSCSFFFDRALYAFSSFGVGVAFTKVDDVDVSFVIRETQQFATDTSA